RRTRPVRSCTGDARMSDTRGLLQRITALRQRLNQAQGMLQEAGATAANLLTAPKTPNLAEKLEEQVVAGARVQLLLDSSLRQIAGVLDGEDGVRPTQLTRAPADCWNGAATWSCDCGPPPRTRR